MKFLKTSLIATALIAAGFAGNAAAAAPVTGSFKVQITITESCAFSTAGASDIIFANKVRSSAGDVLNQGALVVNCTTGTPFNIGLNQGAGTSVTTRVMTSAANNTVGYSLYRDAARTLNWGNTVGTDTQAGTGTSADQTFPVYGRVLGSGNVNKPAGVYSDTLVATITY